MPTIKKLQILGEFPTVGTVDPSTVEGMVDDYLQANPPVGIDGVSPTVSVAKTESGYEVSITDAEGTNTFELLNGTNGQPGETPVKGEDYFTDEDIADVAEQAAALVSIDEVDPDKVIFPDGLTTTYAIGKVTLTNGMGTLVQPGGTLTDFFNNFVDEKRPDITTPTLYLETNYNTYNEVGAMVTPKYKATLNKANYSYGPFPTGVEPTEWVITDTNGHSETIASSAFTCSDTLAAFQMTDNTEYRITVKVAYSEGATPVTNLGNNYPAGKIAAGVLTTSSYSFNKYRKTFYGTLTEKGEITSDVIRTLESTTRNTSFDKNYTFRIPEGALRVIIARQVLGPDGIQLGTITIKDTNAMNADITDSFKKERMYVEGANGYEAVLYDVYTLDFAEPNDTVNEFVFRLNI